MAIGHLLAVALAASTALLGGTSSVHGANAYSYDIDSLCYMSSEVIEGILMTAGNSATVEFKITSAYKGHLRPDQMISLMSLEGYTKAIDRATLRSVGLESGDRLFLFLRPTKTPKDRSTIDQGGDYHPIPSGVKLVTGNRVLAFSQWGNPGPYLAENDRENGFNEPSSLEKFRERLNEGLRKCIGIAELLKPNAAALNLPRLEQLLRDRSSNSDYMNRDHIAELACARIANLHDIDTLARALLIPLRYHAVGTLQRGFGTPEGREFLLKAVGDTRKQMADRIRYAQVIEHAGEEYHSRFTEINDGDGGLIPFNR